MKLLARTALRNLLVVSGVSLSSLPSLAGVLPPCVGATLSANRHVLVTNDVTLSDSDGSHSQKVTGSKFHVLQEVRQVEGINPGLRFVGPDTYWMPGFIGALWTVSFPSEESKEIVACPYVLVTDDAEFLVMVMNSPSRNALRIYRRREHPGRMRIEPRPDSGVLIKAISTEEFIPPSASSSPMLLLFTDHSPQWYSNGIFSFTEDQRTLIYIDKVLGTLRVDLATGVISKELVSNGRRTLTPQH